MAATKSATLSPARFNSGSQNNSTDSLPSKGLGKKSKKLKKHDPKSKKVQNTALSDALKGTGKYAGTKAHTAVHGKVSEAERDNAALAGAHKLERSAEIGAKKIVRGTISGIKKYRGEKKFQRLDIAALEKIHGKGYSKKELIVLAYGKGATSLTLPDMPRSLKFKTDATRRMSTAMLGGLILEKKGATVLGKAVEKGKKGLQFGAARLDMKVRGKLEEAGQENTGMKAAYETAQIAEKPTKYVMKKGARKVQKEMAKTLPARTWNNAKQGIRKMWANQQRRFLSKHKTVAKARGAVMKAKAIVRELILKAKPIAITIGVLVLVSALFQSVVTPAIAFFKAGAETILMTTYPVENRDIHDSTTQWKDLEVALEQRIENIETEFPGFDEYLYDIDPMAHDPFELMAYLSAMHLDFTHPEVASEIAELFGEQNALQIEEIIETRYDSDDEPYEYKILKVSLKPKPFTEVAEPRLTGASAKEMYDLYMGSGGNRQVFGNPFALDWRSRISSYYGQRKNPTGSGYEFHTGIDIALPEGTPIQSIQNGVVTVAGWHDLYGNYIVVRDIDNNSSLYAHCHSMNVSVGSIVLKGQPVGTVGTTGNSTGNHLHLEIKIKGERVNPLFYIGYSSDTE